MGHRPHAAEWRRRSPTRRREKRVVESYRLIQQPTLARERAGSFLIGSKPGRQQGAEKPAVTRLSEQRRNHTFGGRQHLVDLRRALAAGLGEVRAAAAAAADDGRELLDDLAGLEPAGEVLRDRDDHLHLAVVVRRQDHDAAADARAEGVGQPAQRVLVEPVDLRRASLTPGHLDGVVALGRPVAAAERELHLELRRPRGPAAWHRPAAARSARRPVRPARAARRARVERRALLAAPRRRRPGR